MRQKHGRRADHPDEEMLLLFLDGELSSREEKAIEIHLEKCADCRARRQVLLAGLDAAGEYGRAAVWESAGVPPNGWHRFAALLDRVSHQK
jgi:hypothetical protein